MKVKKLSVHSHINLPDGQGMDLSVSGTAEMAIDLEQTKLVLQNLVNSGVLAILKSEILRSLEEKHAEDLFKIRPLK